MQNKCYIVDTTLRDGEQSAGIAFRLEDKVRLGTLMDEAGIYEIEAGIPGLGIEEQEAIYRIMKDRKHAQIAAWNRMQISDIKASIACQPDIIHISVPISYTHIYSRLKKNKQWLKNNLMECVSYAITSGCKVSVGFEDASRADISFIISLATLLKKMGVSHIRYADTVGILTPHGAVDVIKSIRHYAEIDVEVHVHNDFGMAVANSLEAAKSGAKYIDCTFLGIGERAGNCDCAKFIKAGEGLFDFDISKPQIIQIQQEIYRILKQRELTQVSR